MRQPSLQQCRAGTRHIPTRSSCRPNRPTTSPRCARLVGLQRDEVEARERAVALLSGDEEHRLVSEKVMGTVPLGLVIVVFLDALHLVGGVW
jgi:hypothetical protein